MLDRQFSPVKPHQKRVFERWKRRIGEISIEQAEENSFKGFEMKQHGQQMDMVLGLDGSSRNKEVSYMQQKQAEEEKRINEAINSVDEPLNYVPSVPEYSVIDVVPYLNDSITEVYLRIPKRTYKYKIVILTPVCDVAHLIEGYVKALSSLTYPHELISVYFGEDSSSDRTLDMAKLMAKELVVKHRFSKADVFHLNNSGGVHGNWMDVHDKLSQLKRRSHLAKSRNLLLRKGLTLDKFDYVFWVDSDIKTLPSDLIQQLLFAEADVVVPSCLFAQGRYKKVFDKNSWRETPTSIEDQRKLPDDILIVEGYSHSYRIFLPDLKLEGRIVSLDGVGGCALMIKESCHRSGLVFPEEVYSHHIETEGLAKLATSMGYSVKGMPWVEVFHN